MVHDEVLDAVNKCRVPLLGCSKEEGQAKLTTLKWPKTHPNETSAGAYYCKASSWLSSDLGWPSWPLDLSVVDVEPEVSSVLRGNVSCVGNSGELVVAVAVLLQLVAGKLEDRVDEGIRLLKGDGLVG